MTDRSGARERQTTCGGAAHGGEYHGELHVATTAFRLAKARLPKAFWSRQGRKALKAGAGVQILQNETYTKRTAKCQ
jgi:hypothetical protein